MAGISAKMRNAALILSMFLLSIVGPAVAVTIIDIKPRVVKKENRWWVDPRIIIDLIK